ncbi:hypothetical protein QF032_004400 [Streptomyces achromogenes]|uniref:Lipoprotein n=1 Tax=Streptomyces achromogenes TaxID=67255 RepID=A0ABU0Q405_STRAH|nr:hypothetical protein [Streptomyces achromogenes]MDQ0685401.1 hypothetical protein [Streptomyces achromogenes]MDQ0832556.1 hypothetical protein [Streptomyces achromogenes]
MTSAIFSRGASRRTVRAAAVAAALAGALALTACSGDGGSGEDSASTPAATADGGGPGGGAASPSDSVSASDELEGSWLATTDGKAVALIITGKQAALFVTGGSVCSGTAGKEGGMRMIHLTCTVGKDDRATGMVDSVDAKSLEVTWTGAAGKETFTRAEGGQWPSGLPTAGIG